MAQLPEWQPLHEVAPPLPAEDGSGRIIALVASATSEGWSPSAAVSLASEWASQGHRVMLVDGGLTKPSLHGAADLTNREGLTDAVLYGASIERVAQPLPGGAGFFVSTGTPVAVASAVPTHDRWARIRQGMSQAGVTLLVFLPEDDEATAAFLDSATDIALFGGPGDAVPAVLADRGGVTTFAGPSDAAVDSAPAMALVDPATDGYADPAGDAGADADLTEDVDPGYGDGFDEGPVDSATDSATDVEQALGRAGEMADSVRPKVEAGGGGVSMILFVVLAVIAAAALGWFMVSGLG